MIDSVDPDQKPMPMAGLFRRLDAPSECDSMIERKALSVTGVEFGVSAKHAANILTGLATIVSRRA
jgi:hypothetical protein